jgi:hypothetical protein
LPQSKAILSRIEAILTALLFALILAVGLMTFVFAPRVRGLMEQSGRTLSEDVRTVLSPAFWPVALGLLLVATAAAIIAHSARVRRASLAIGLVAGSAAIGIYTARIARQTDFTELVTEGQKPIDRQPPKQLLPGP